MLGSVYIYIYKISFFLLVLLSGLPSSVLQKAAAKSREIESIYGRHRKESNDGCDDRSSPQNSEDDIILLIQSLINSIAKMICDDDFKEIHAHSLSDLQQRARMLSSELNWWERFIFKGALRSQDVTMGASTWSLPGSADWGLLGRAFDVQSILNTQDLSGSQLCLLFSVELYKFYICEKMQLLFLWKEEVSGFGTRVKFLMTWDSIEGDSSKKTQKEKEVVGHPPPNSPISLKL